MYKTIIKRLLDIIFSITLLFLLSPLFTIICILEIIFIGFPIFFIQERIGKDNKIFKMIKFRTMKNTKDKKGDLLPDHLRKSKFGCILRTTSIDELPELINIMIGDLSFIGPRPLIKEYLPYYREDELIRHSIRGGLLQPEVMYKNIYLTWDEQFKYELNYVQNLSFFLDLKIFFCAFGYVLRRLLKKYGDYERKSLIEERKNENSNSST